MSAPYNVLFLCTGNSARSILAEAILNKLGSGQFNAYSAGSHPGGTVNPFALRTLEQMGMEAAGSRSKSWDEFAKPGAPAMDFVFTVCDSAAGEVCPVWPGHPMAAHWGLEDPAAFEGSDEEKLRFFSKVANQLVTRICLFINLPHATLDRPRLQHELAQIGKIKD